jgi:carbonic anhydrase/acetyltransferase-like protein (isoleucine patch superfamily)
MILEHFAKPKIAGDAFVAETAVVLGDVEIAGEASIWYGAVLRGDMGKITVERKANVQDNVVIHSEHAFPVVVGEGASVGHGAVIHACRIGKYSLRIIFPHLYQAAEVIPAANVGSQKAATQGPCNGRKGAPCISFFIQHLDLKCA